jgi:hypothetical protein
MSAKRRDFTSAERRGYVCDFTSTERRSYVCDFTSTERRGYVHRIRVYRKPDAQLVVRRWRSVLVHVDGFEPSDRLCKTVA